MKCFSPPIVQAAESAITAQGWEAVNKGCRKFMEDEYELFLAVAGLPEETKKEELEGLGFTFVRDWERTTCKETKMRTMIARRVLDSAKTLHLANPVRYLRPGFVNSIKDQQYSRGLGSSYWRSHLGISLAAVSYMIGTSARAATDTNRDQYMDAASHTTAADEEARLGKPGLSHQGLEKLIKAIGAYLSGKLVNWMGAMSHAAFVKLIREELQKVENDDVPIEQEQCD
jgi:hypothetical protein